MATSVPFNPNNKIYERPLDEGEEIGNTGPLYAYNNGVLSMTCWQLSPEELEEVCKTGQVWLAVRTANRAMRPTWLGSYLEMKRQTLDFAGGIWFKPGHKQA